MRDDVKFLAPKVGATDGYVRLAYGGESKSLNELKQLNEQGATPGAQPVIDTPSTTPPPVDATHGAGGPPSDIVRQQQEINAIQAEKPPPDATQQQLDQWQQSKQQRIQQILNSK